MDKRSTTSPLCNSTVFNSARLLEKLPELIDPSQAPPDDLLPTFLHEATHHWCFTSHVGTTIAILAMRGRVNAVRALEATDPREAKMWGERAADDMVRAEVATLLLQPLAEGMATFAEFDLSVSNRSPVVPPPLRWAIMFAAKDKLTGSPDNRVRRRMDLAMETCIALMKGRWSERSRRAKEALFLEPLSCGTGGYLAGYLLMRTCWEFMQVHHERFNEPELFLLKMYDIFYQDIEFANLLVDPSQRIPDVLNPLVIRLAERLEYALSTVKESLDGFFESQRLARSKLYDREDVDGRVLPQADPCDNNPSARFVAIWHQLMDDTIISVYENEGCPLARSASFGMHMIGYGRDYLELGAVSAQLIVGETETAVVVEGKTAAKLPTRPGIPQGETSGVVHILLNTRNGEYVVAAASDSQEQLISLRTTSDASKVDNAELERGVFGRIYGGFRVAIAMSLAREKKGVDKQKQLPELAYLSGYLQQTRERLDGLYLPWATNHVPVPTLEKIIPKMINDGMFGALDYKADLVRGLAIIGSMANLSQSSEHLASEFDNYGLDYDSIIKELREYSRSTHLFRIIGDSFIRSSPGGEGLFIGGGPDPLESMAAALPLELRSVPSDATGIAPAQLGDHK